jgi:hypothetical protein
MELQGPSRWKLKVRFDTILRYITVRDTAYSATGQLSGNSTGVDPAEASRSIRHLSIDCPPSNITSFASPSFLLAPSHPISDTMVILNVLGCWPCRARQANSLALIPAHSRDIGYLLIRGALHVVEGPCSASISAHFVEHAYCPRWLASVLYGGHHVRHRTANPRRVNSTLTVLYGRRYA